MRYLDESAQAGDPRPLFLTVGSYPVPDAVAALRKAAAQPGVKLRQVASGGLALINIKNPTSVYLAYPGSDDQIEVYDPSPQRALRLVLSGQVKPVG